MENSLNELAHVTSWPGRLPSLVLQKGDIGRHCACDGQLYGVFCRARNPPHPIESNPCAPALAGAAGVLVPWGHNPLVLLGHHLEKENEGPACH